MTQDRRQVEGELLRVVQLNNREAGLRALQKLLELRVGKQVEALLQCQPCDMVERRAEVLVLQKLLKEISVEPTA